MTIKVREDFTLTRIREGYSITGLANKMGVNPSVVFGMEKGHGVRPRTAKKAASALQMKFEDLFIIEN